MNSALFTIFVQTLLPLCICVVLPIMVVWLWTRMKTRNNDKRAEIVLEALKKDNDIDAGKLVEALASPKKTALEVLHNRLMYGCRFSLVGIAILICSYASYLKFYDDGIWYNLLVVGSIVLAIGISFLVVYFVTRKSVTETSEQDKE